MRNLIRSPLTWLVAAEFVVVAALVAVAWNVIASANRPSSPSVAGTSLATDDPSTDLPDIPQLNASPPHGPMPGLAVDPNFWRDRLGQLNGDQVYLEQLEWQIVHSAQAAAERYVETVVLPAIRRAEHAGGAVVV
jgi:hypothetical protein